MEVNDKIIHMLDLCAKIDNYFNEDVKYDDKTVEVLSLIVKEICENEECSLDDIELISGRGNYSVVFGIGDKVLKLGKKREKLKIHNNPYIIKPIIRQYIADNLFVEVSEKVDTNISVSNEELYEIYKSIRDLGLVWTDVNKRNVGRLNKDNIIYWNDYINTADEVLNFDSNRGEEKLKKGQLVVIDIDHIYEEGDPDIRLADDSYYTAFEYQYKKDKKIR